MRSPAAPSPLLPRVAVIADAHFHDMAGDFGTDGPARRSWADTRSGARAVNESRGALLAALGEVVAHGIRHVVLLGDYSDDGQRETVARLADLLADHEHRCGLRFYALPGNHDVYALHGKHRSTRYIDAGGVSRLLTSDPELAATEPQGAVLAPGMYCEGLPAGLLPMARFGLFRQAGDLHWESPFGPDDASGARCFTARAADGSVGHRMMDASYLVEPEAGLWLLMIDATVFEPRAGRADATRKRAFHDPSNAGWNAVLRVKPFLLPWIADVHTRAGALGKALLVFSHYPALDPFEQGAQSETALFGQTETALRMPRPEVGEALAAAGVRCHFSGHIHADGLTQGPGGLWNVAVPSLVSFPPGFKVVQARGAGADTALRIETVSLALPVDANLRQWYAPQASPARSAALEAPGYGAFLRAQMRARVLERTVPEGWPPRLAAALPAASAADLVALLCDPDPGARLLHAQEPAVVEGLDPAELAGCPLGDLVADWYALRQAGPLMAPWLDAGRLQLYRSLAARFGDPGAVPARGDAAFFARFLFVMHEAIDRMERPAPEWI